MLGKKCALAVLCIEATIVGITDCLAADQVTGSIELENQLDRLEADVGILPRCVFCVP